MSGWEVLREILRTVLLMSASGGVVAVLLFALKPLIKDRITQTVQYYLWLLVLAALLVPFSVFISVPINTPMNPVKEVVDKHVKTTQEWYEERAEAQYDLPFHELKSHEQVDVIYQDHKWWMNNVLLTVPVACGFMAFLAAVFNYFTYTSKLRSKRLPATEREMALLRQLVPGQRQPHLYRNSLVPTPMLLGICRPTIYLPDRKYSEVQLTNILRHELTHLQRHDVIVKWMAALALHIHWFNPLVYLVRREIDRACELACDEEVIKGLNIAGKQAYGDTLIAMAAQKKLPQTVLSTTMCEEKKSLKARLGAIMNYQKPRRWVMVLSCVLLVAAACGTVVLGAKSVAPVSAPQVQLYEGNLKDWSVHEPIPIPGHTQLLTDPETGVITLPPVTEAVIVHKDYTGKSTVDIYCTSLEEKDGAYPLVGGAAAVSVGHTSQIKNLVLWNVAESYPHGFDGYVWAVVRDEKGREYVSKYTRVVYDPAKAH